MFWPPFSFGAGVSGGTCRTWPFRQRFSIANVQKDCQNRKREIGYMPLENCPFLKIAYFQSLFSTWLQGAGRGETLGTRLDIDEFLSGSDKVNPKFVKETRQSEAKCFTDSGNSDELAASDPTTVADGEKTNDANDSPCPPKKKKKGQVLKAKRQKAPS